MQCKVEIPSIPGLPDGEITVGRDFLLHCEGEWPKGFEAEIAKFDLPAEQKHALKLRALEFRDMSAADLKVTSYLAGDVRVPELIVQAKDQSVSLGQVQFQVKSMVQAPKEQGQKPEPFGPFGPAQIGWPVIYTLLLALILLSLTTWIAVFFFRKNQRKKLLQELAEHDSALEPGQQFYQSLRGLQRKNFIFYSSPEVLRKNAELSKTATTEAIQVIDQAVRVFLSREFKIPAFQWKTAVIVKDLKKYHRSVYKNAGPQLKKLLVELEGVQKNPNLEPADALALYKKSLKWFELATQKEVD